MQVLMPKAVDSEAAAGLVGESRCLPAQVAEGAVVDAASGLVVPEPADGAEVAGHACSTPAAASCMPLHRSRHHHHTVLRGYAWGCRVWGCCSEASCDVRRACGWSPVDYWKKLCRSSSRTACFGKYQRSGAQDGSRALLYTAGRHCKLQPAQPADWKLQHRAATCQTPSLSASRGQTCHRLLQPALHADHVLHGSLLQPVVLSLVVAVAAGVHTLAAGRHQLAPVHGAGNQPHESFSH